MPALQVKDFPSDVYDDLRQCAAQEDRSISQQTIHILRRYLALYKTAARTSGSPEAVVFNTIEDATAARIKQREEVFRQIEELPPLDIPDEDDFIVKMIHEGREERMAFVDEMIEEMLNDRSR